MFGKKAVWMAVLAAAVAAAFAVVPAKKGARAVAAPAAAGQVRVVKDGEYTGKDEVAAYVRTFGGALPRNFITKKQARELGWKGGSLEPYAPGKSIGGDRFGNYERRLPNGSYRECDIDTRGRPRGAKRLVFTQDGKKIYYTHDHYSTFEEVKP